MGALVPAYFLWALITFLTSLSWPIERFRQIYLGIGQLPLVISVSVWVLVASFHPAVPHPQDYIPFLNPVEFVQLLSLGALVQWSMADADRRSSKNRWPALGFIGFVALNGGLARTACRFLELPFEAGALLSSGVFHALLSVVWTTAALVIMLVATHLEEAPRVASRSRPACGDRDQAVPVRPRRYWNADADRGPSWSWVVSSLSSAISHRCRLKTPNPRAPDAPEPLPTIQRPTSFQRLGRCETVLQY